MKKGWYILPITDAEKDCLYEAIADFTASDFKTIDRRQSAKIESRIIKALPTTLLTVQCSSKLAIDETIGIRCLLQNFVSITIIPTFNIDCGFDYISSAEILVEENCCDTDDTTIVS